MSSARVPAVIRVAGADVIMIRSLAVDPQAQRQGIGRRLVAAAIHEADARGPRRIRLRVLGANAGAQALYASAGFVVEGVLRDEFLLDCEYVDDVLMALDFVTD